MPFLMPTLHSKYCIVFFCAYIFAVIQPAFALRLCLVGLCFFFAQEDVFVVIKREREERCLEPSLVNCIKSRLKKFFKRSKTGNVVNLIYFHLHSVYVVLCLFDA